MHLLVLGGSGPTGRHVVRQGVGAGHTVVVPTRHPGSSGLEHPSVRLVQADVTSLADVRRVVTADVDAVVSTYGVPYSRRPVTVYSVGVGHLVTAMREAGVERVVCVSSTTVDDRPTPGQPWWYDVVVHRLLRRVVGRTLYDDMERMEAVLRSSGLAWTVARPAGLFDDDEPRDDRIVTTGRAPGRSTSRPDLAAALLDLATTDRHVGRVVDVLSARGPAHPLRTMLREARGS